MKKKINIFLLVGLVWLTGCNDNQEKPNQKKFEDIKVFCDTETNLEYLVFDGYKAGGLSVRYNTDGSIKQCTRKVENE